MNEKEEIFENSKVVFGLVAQGHIPTIERLIDEGKQWDEIGREIGWCPITAREHFERHLRPVTKENCYLGSPAAVCPLLARAVEMLRKIGSEPNVPVWERNSISEFIYHSEKHLLSSPIIIHPILKPDNER